MIEKNSSQFIKQNFIMRDIVNKILLSLMLASSSVIFAQQTISGIVTDQEGNPLPSVSIIIKNSEKGVSTDFDGNFSIDAS